MSNAGPSKHHLDWKKCISNFIYSMHALQTARLVPHKLNSENSLQDH